MVFEAAVLCCYEGIHNMLADFVIVGIDSVACVAEVSAEFLPVGGVYD
jgi:hypothetical protein